MIGKTFQQVRDEATKTWGTLLSKITVSGGTERQKGLFYSTLYRSFLWPALRSDINGDFTDQKGNVVNKDSVTIPSLRCGTITATSWSCWECYPQKLPKMSSDH